ncbi:MAG: winged helix DNA-binding domain-containing protein, partial [Chloroflexota bacterium]
RDALHARTIVRATLMRATLHLMSASDYLAFRIPLQPMLSAALKAVLRQRAEGIDLPALLERARTHFTARPSTFTELRAALADQFPDLDERAMGYTVRLNLPLVMDPDDSPWAFPTNARFTLADAWLGQAPEDDPNPEALVRRYLAAFGPASATDMQAWSGVAGIQAILNTMRPTLVTFRDERKRELFDLPHAPRPPAESPAPVRFLPEFDNILLAHADRQRIIADTYRPLVVTRNLLVLATFLVDGFVAGTWKLERKRHDVTLTLTPFEPISSDAQVALIDEGERLARWVEPGANAYRVEVGIQANAR